MCEWYQLVRHLGPASRILELGRNTEHPPNAAVYPRVPRDLVRNGLPGDTDTLNSDIKSTRLDALLRASPTLEISRIATSLQQRNMLSDSQSQSANCWSCARPWEIQDQPTLRSRPPLGIFARNEGTQSKYSTTSSKTMILRVIDVHPEFTVCSSFGRKLRLMTLSQPYARRSISKLEVEW